MLIFHFTYSETDPLVDKESSQKVLKFILLELTKWSLHILPLFMMVPDP